MPGAIKKGWIYLFLSAVCLSASGCTSFQRAGDLPSGIPESSIRPIIVIAEATATPIPEVIIRDPVKSRSPMRIMNDVPENTSIPEFYALVDLEAIPHAVYAYTSTTGETLYRVYGEVDNLEDGIVVSTDAGFYGAVLYLEDSGYRLETNKDEMPITQEQETPQTILPCPVPTKQYIRSYIREAEKATKAYETAKAKAEKNDEPLPEEPVWDGLPVLTSETVPVVLPKQYKVADKSMPGFYYFDNQYGIREYRRYGTNNGVDSAFYATGEDGQICVGALPIDFDRDNVPERYKARKLVEKPSDQYYRLPIIIRTSNGIRIPADTVYRLPEVSE